MTLSKTVCCSSKTIENSGVSVASYRFVRIVSRVTGTDTARDKKGGEGLMTSRHSNTAPILGDPEAVGGVKGILVGESLL